MLAGTSTSATGRRLNALVLGNFLAVGMTVAAIPRYLHTELQASRTATGLATTIYFVAALIVRPFIGAAVDRIGRRPFLIVPPAISAVLTLGYLTVDTVLGITVLRFLTGAVAALLFTSVVLVVTDSVPEQQRTRALGRQSVMTYGGLILGPVIVDRLIQVGWTAVWLAPAACYLFAAAVGTTLPETRDASQPVSTARAGFDRRVLRPATGVLASSFGFSAIVAFLPEYAERLGIDSPGTLFAVYAATVLVVRLISGPIADRIGPSRFMTPALAVGMVGLAWLAVARSPWQSYIAIALVGLGLGASFPAATAAALARADSGDRGKAVGTTLALGDIGQATAGPLVGYLSTLWGFEFVYLLPALVCAAAIALIRLPARAA